MRLTSLADYAVVTMTAAARHAAGARQPAASANITATNLAADTGIPLPTVQKLMGHLARAGLLTSARGTGGGFLLAKSADSITLAEIIEAIEGPIAMTKCVEGRAEECELEGSCISKPHLQAANAAVRGALERVSLASISGTAQ